MSPDSDVVGVPKEGASWQQIKANHCNGETYTATLVIISARGKRVEKSVTFRYSGKATRRQAGDIDYGCTNVSVVNVKSANSNTTTS
jgi:hypothetical protein